MTRIVADDAIPHVEAAFGAFGELRRLPGRAIRRSDLAHADVLLTRTVTRVDADLVEGTPVKLVASATAGVDHIDRSALQNLGITVVHAPGANAQAVVEYVLSAIVDAAAQRPSGWLRGRPIGIVGFGNIGGRLARLLRSLGLCVLTSDPPLRELVERGGVDAVRPAADAATARGEAFVSLPELVARAGIVTLHVPLVETGPWPTRHLVDEEVLGHLADDALLINTSRGEIVREDALRRWLARQGGRAVLDVWDHEPHVDPALVGERGLLRATPHIAGYTVEGKARATARIHVAVAEHLGVAPWFLAETITGSPLEGPPIADDARSDLAWLGALLRWAHDFDAIDAALRSLASADPVAVPYAFEAMRRSTPLRRELSHFLRPPLPHFGRRELPADLRDVLDSLCPSDRGRLPADG
jgi:erythronate-4-phosphate dehydrogenase